MMRIHLGSVVHTSEGHMAGKVSRIVLDPSRQAVDALIVHTGWLGHDLIVPLKAIQEVDAGEAVHLNINSEGFRRLRPYFQVSFASSEGGGMDVQTDHIAGGGQMPMPASGLGSPSTSMGHQFDPADSSFMGVGTTGYDTITSSSSLDENEVPITRGTRVVTRDGHHVGNIHDVQVATDGRLDGLIVASGHIRVHHSFVAAPEVIDASPEELWVGMTAAQFANLGQSSQPQHDLGEAAP